MRLYLRLIETAREVLVLIDPSIATRSPKMRRPCILLIILPRSHQTLGWEIGNRIQLNAGKVAN